MNEPETELLAAVAGVVVSDRQWRDLLGVLKVQAGALDQEYLKHWAAELRVAGLLRRALDEADLS